MQAMPPGCSDQLEAAVAPVGNPFAALPHALALAVCALLPVDQRLRCAEVCRGWRALLSDVGLWLRLDLSPAGGVARASDALLRAAAARAAGGLQALDLTGCRRISLHAVCLVAAQNAGALAELRMGHHTATGVRGALCLLSLSSCCRLRRSYACSRQTPSARA
jgi:hypothetical protein